MLRASILFLLIALLAMLLGMYGIAGISFELGKFLLFVFLAFSIVAFIVSILFDERHRHPPPT